MRVGTKMLFWILLLGADTALAGPPAGDQPAQDLQVRLEQARQRLDDAVRELADLHRELGGSTGIFVHERKGMLGIVLGPPEGDGVQLVGVTPGSGAEAAGLRAGDVIVSVSGVPVEGSIRNLTHALESPAPGDIVSVDYLRGDERGSVDVTISEPRPFEMPLPGPGGVGNVEFGVAMASTDAPSFAAFGPDGLRLHNLDASLGRCFGVSSGVLVLQAAQASGLEGGDVLLRVADELARDAASAFGRLMNARDGLIVTLLRDGTERTVDFVAGSLRPQFDHLIPLQGPGPGAGEDTFEVQVLRSE